MEKYNAYVEKHRRLILDSLDYLWKNPEAGYKEWKTHAYAKAAFEKLGYSVTEAGNVPGFTALADTGRPGPRLAIFGEMDALIIPGHPECDPETGAVHACGHCAQLAALIGIAAALKEPGALDGLSGQILLVAVPAEELIEIEERIAMRREGKIKYFGGKPEFLYRGLLDGVDLSFMVHTSGPCEGGHGAGSNGGSNGLIAKTVSFQGVSAHAGGAPHRGVNALYAATLALNAINSLRETFQDSHHIRVHPIITGGGASVNAIPDLVTMESYVRGADMPSIVDANDKVNRAIAGAAAAMGARACITDFPGYWPRLNKPDFIGAFQKGAEAAGMTFHYNQSAWGTGCSDMGDMAAVMPAAHPYANGAVGNSHGVDYRIADPENACVDSAKMQLQTARILLENDAVLAKQIVTDYTPAFASFQEYFDFVDSLDMEKQTVTYGEGGQITLEYKK